MSETRDVLGRSSRVELSNSTYLAIREYLEYES